jgi:hypothetical protein
MVHRNRVPRSCFRRQIYLDNQTSPSSTKQTVGLGRRISTSVYSHSSNYYTLHARSQYTTNMSSMIDGYAPTPAGPRSDTPSHAPSPAPSSRSRLNGRSSSRPRAANSIMGTPAAYSDAPFPDDEVVGRGPRRQVPGADIPRVVDTTAESLSERFQEFLEQCVSFRQMP